MGHYDSQYKADDERIRKANIERIERLRKAIAIDLESRSLPEVLADIVNDPDGYRRHRS